ncbi:MAG: hypothetical protein ACT4PU_04855 [Planctomycetota bacterium]
MAWRLPSIFAAMALLLVAGVLSVQHLESHVGATAVGGLVLVALPELDDAAAVRLAARWPGASATWVDVQAPADAQQADAQAGEPFAPFLQAAVGQRAAHGEATVLLQTSRADLQPPPEPSVPGPRDAAAAESWLVRIEGDTDLLLRSAADFLREQTGTRPFVLGLDLRAAPGVALGQGATAPVRSLRADDVGPQLNEALADLPSFRRTSIVMLGPADETGRRTVLRVDRGRPAAPLLTDLLWTEP